MVETEDVMEVEKVDEAGGGMGKGKAKIQYVTSISLQLVETKCTVLLHADLWMAE